MRKGLLRYTWVAALAASWGLTAAGMAQNSPGPLSRLFGSRPAETKVPAAKPKLEEGHRSLEIHVELAWLADTATFPYFLEARMEGPALEVRGYVPNKMVRDQAVKLARLHCPMPVVDALKEHPRLEVKATKVTSVQLQNNTMTSLRESFPKSHGQYQVQCSADGTIILTGATSTLDEKLAVSQALRRLHGCTAVNNQLQVTNAGPALANAQPQRPVEALKTSQSTIVKTGANQPLPNKSTTDRFPEPALLQPPGDEPAKKKTQPEPRRPLLDRLFGKKKQDPPPTTPQGSNPYNVSPTKKEPVKITTVDGPVPGKAPTSATPTSNGKQLGEPYESRGTILVPATETKGTAPLKLTPVAQVKKKIEQTCPTARGIQITQTGKDQLKVEINARTAEESGEMAGRVLALPELEPYRVDLHIRVDAPLEKKK